LRDNSRQIPHIHACRRNPHPLTGAQFLLEETAALSQAFAEGRVARQLKVAPKATRDSVSASRQTAKRWKVPRTRTGMLCFTISQTRAGSFSKHASRLFR